MCTVDADDEITVYTLMQGFVGIRESLTRPRNSPGESLDS